MGITAVILISLSSGIKTRRKARQTARVQYFFIIYNTSFCEKNDVESVGIINVWSQIRQIVYV